MTPTIPAPPTPPINPNPLGGQLASNSPQFSLNGLDWMKVLRFVLVQVIGLLLTFAPTLAGMAYKWRGVDYTPIVVMVVNGAAEAARRFLAGRPKD